MQHVGGGTARSRAWAALRERLESEDGFTLTEMVVVMGVLLIVMAALTSLFIAATRTQADMTNRFQAQQNARLALDKLRREIHCASSITAASYPASSVKMRLGGYCPTADHTSLSASFTIPGSGTISVDSTASFPPSALTPA